MVLITLCTLCMSKNELICLFDRHEENPRGINLKQIIITMTGVEITEQDYVSLKICRTCYNSISNMYECRKYADEYLKDKCKKIVNASSSLKIPNTNITITRVDNNVANNTVQVIPNEISITPITPTIRNEEVNFIKSEQEPVSTFNSLSMGVHPSIHSIRNKYTNITLPPGTVNLDMDPNVYMDTEAVKNYFDENKKDIVKAVNDALNTTNEEFPYNSLLIPKYTTNANITKKINVNLYKCDKCKSTYKNALALKVHYKQHLTCKYCKAKFRLLPRKRMHIKNCAVRDAVKRKPYVYLKRIDSMLNTLEEATTKTYNRKEIHSSKVVNRNISIITPTVLMDNDCVLNRINSSTNENNILKQLLDPLVKPLLRKSVRSIQSNFPSYKNITMNGDKKTANLKNLRSYLKYSRIPVEVRNGKFHVQYTNAVDLKSVSKNKHMWNKDEIECLKVGDKLSYSDKDLLNNIANGNSLLRPIQNSSTAYFNVIPATCSFGQQYLNFINIVPNGNTNLAPNTSNNVYIIQHTPGELPIAPSNPTNYINTTPQPFLINSSNSSFTTALIEVRKPLIRVKNICELK